MAFGSERLSSAIIKSASKTHANIGLNASVVVSPMPLFHTAGSVLSVLGCAASRSTLVLSLLFEPTTVLASMEEMKADVFFGVPTMLVALMETCKSAPRDISSLRIASTGGATVPAELHKRVKDILGIPLVSVYGQTEFSPIVSQTSPDDPEDKRVHTDSRPLWNVEVRIADPVDLTVTPIGVEGEIQARGYQAMLKYFDNPEDTARTITADGWLRTGDLGTMDRDGYLNVTGRLKDMIIRGGENIYPVEIEACLLRHPDVTDVAVFGAPDAKWGEVVAAAIRLAPGAQADAAALTAHCREAMAPHKTPALWFRCGEFPLTASGKVQKFRLRDALAEGLLEKLG